MPPKWKFIAYVQSEWRILWNNIGHKHDFECGLYITPTEVNIFREFE